MGDNRPNLPSVLNSEPLYPTSSSSSGSGPGIKLPPISFLSNLSGLNESSDSSTPQTVGGSSAPSSGGLPRLLNSQSDNNQPSFQHILSSESNHPSSSGSTGPSAPVISKLNEGSNKLKDSSRQSITNLIDSNQSSITSPIKGQGLGIPVKLKEEITKPDIEEESDEAIIKYYENKYGFNDFTEEEKHDILQHEKRARIEKAKNPNYKTYLCYSIIKRLNTVPKDKSQVQQQQQSHQQESTTLVTQEESKNPENEDNKEQKEQQIEEFKPVTKLLKRKVIINNNDVLNSASKFPRKHLGSILYTSYPTIETHQQIPVYTPPSNELKIDYTKKLPLLPDLSNYINSTLTIRIPSHYITNIQNNENFQNRAIWGSDIYTDDSDILLILKHCGWLPEQGEETTKLLPGNPTPKPSPLNRSNKFNITQTVDNFRQFINLIGGDIHIDLIILPKLTSYKGIYRNGVNSRDWIRHDGASISLYGIRYGEKGSSIDSVNSSELKKRKLKELQEIKNLSDSQKFKISKEAWEFAKKEIEDAELKKNNKKKKDSSDGENTENNENI